MSTNSFFNQQSIQKIKKVHKGFLWVATGVLIASLLLGMILIFVDTKNDFFGKTQGTFAVLALAAFICVNGFIRIEKGNKLIQGFALIGLVANFVWLVMAILMIWGVLSPMSTNSSGVGVDNSTVRSYNYNGSGTLSLADDYDDEDYDDEDYDDEDYDDEDYDDEDYDDEDYDDEDYDDEDYDDEDYDDEGYDDDEYYYDWDNEEGSSQGGSGYTSFDDESSNFDDDNVEIDGETVDRSGVTLKEESRGDYNRSNNNTDNTRLKVASTSSSANSGFGISIAAKITIIAVSIASIGFWVSNVLAIKNRVKVVKVLKIAAIACQVISSVFVMVLVFAWPMNLDQTLLKWAGLSGLASSGFIVMALAAWIISITHKDFDSSFVENNSIDVKPVTESSSETEKGEENITPIQSSVEFGKVEEEVAAVESSIETENAEEGVAVVESSAEAEKTEDSMPVAEPQNETSAPQEDESNFEGFSNTNTD